MYLLYEKTSNGHPSSIVPLLSARNSQPSVPIFDHWDDTHLHAYRLSMRMSKEYPRLVHHGSDSSRNPRLVSLRTYRTSINVAPRCFRRTTSRGRLSAPPWLSFCSDIVASDAWELRVAIFTITNGIPMATEESIVLQRRDPDWTTTELSECGFVKPTLFNTTSGPMSAMVSPQTPPFGTNGYLQYIPYGIRNATL